MTALTLGDRDLTLDDLRRLVSDRPPRLVVGEEARARVAAARGVVEEALRSGGVHYGVNTGFGRLSSVRIGDADLRRLQVNLVRSHACGVGEPLDRGLCRLAFALRIHNLARGHSGVRVRLVDHLVAMFAAGVVPVLPSQGSVGASGDLAPLAHMALVVVGEGRAWHRRRIKDGAAALAAAGLRPLRLHSKEGLALLNGTQVSTAVLADAVLRARGLRRVADVACALTLEAYKGTDTAFDARIHALRRHAGQRTVASNLRRLLEGSEILPSHRTCPRVQDNYCLRCAPQVHGASEDAIAYVTGVVLAEANAVTDNPLVFEEGDILSGGNFHAQPVAVAADLLKIAAAELADISERRIELLLNPDVSDLPPFLAGESGLQSGMMIAHVTAAALVSENKVLAHPASVDSIPTSAGKEDHVSMATHGARQARQIVAHVESVLAIELLAGVHALALETRYRAGAGVEAARRHLRRLVRPLTRDRELAPDIEAVAGSIRDGSLLAAVEAEVGALD